ncbi:unnamed protein product [Coffea canephora]|uniref:Fe2OG dioxygenase domain-containing protein n=1 Tax=Coffea canephora TaxID=49390 RepID=A0A068TPY7_COFCA|nr:unnamed protein product [Coffea canephora]
MMGSDQTLEKALPIIHFNSENLTPGSSSWLSTSEIVRKALESYGCFVAVYKNISPELHDKMLNLSKELFDVPVEIKVQNTSDYLGFGYGGNYSVMPLIEYLGITNAATLEATKDFTNLIWPDGNDSFCETAFSYAKQLLELKNLMMQMVLENYGVEKHYELLVRSAFHLMRFIKYRTPKTNEINTGLRPHVDKTFLSVLAGNHVKGLQIETKDGEWIDFAPTPSAFLVIAGEGFTAWSNGKVYAPLHRVIIGGAEEKYTIGLFSFMHGTLQIPVELADDDQNPLQFKPFNNVAFLDYCSGDNITARAIKDFCGT